MILARILEMVLGVMVAKEMAIAKAKMAQVPVTPVTVSDPINTNARNKYEEDEDYTDGHWLPFGAFITARAWQASDNWGRADEMALTEVRADRNHA